VTSSTLRPLVERALHRLGAAERIVTCAAFLVLIVAVFADVLSREVTGTGLHWARQAGVYANIVVVLFGLGLASAGGAHLRPRFADAWLPQRCAPALQRLNDFGMAVFCAAFAVVALGMVSDSFALQERSVALLIVIWPFQASVPLAFAVAALRHLVYAGYPELRPADVGALAASADEQGGA
jgi:TRAP-type C4-dicarboxylate transport system permease small subunit